MQALPSPVPSRPRTQNNPRKRNENSMFLPRTLQDQLETVLHPIIICPHVRLNGRILDWVFKGALSTISVGAVCISFVFTVFGGGWSRNWFAIVGLRWLRGGIIGWLGGSVIAAVWRVMMGHGWGTVSGMIGSRGGNVGGTPSW
jgi:hypothetical protein